MHVQQREFRTAIIGLPSTSRRDSRSDRLLSDYPFISPRSIPLLSHVNDKRNSVNIIAVARDFSISNVVDFCVNARS